MSSDVPEVPAAPPNLFDPGTAACPQAAYRQLRELGRVTRAPVFGMPMLSRYEDVMWALRHPEIFSSEMEAQVQLGTERPMVPQQIDPPAQTRYRKILDPRFSRRRTLAMVPEVRRQANALIDAFVGKGECEFDAAFAIPLPCTVFLHLMGLPLEELDLFLELKDGIIRPQTRTHDLEEMNRIRAESGRRIYEYFEKVIDERSAGSDDDVMGYLLQAQLDGRKLTREEILDICFLFLLAGLDTVTATLGCNVAYLAANPDQRRRIVEAPELIPGAVEELLRWETPVTGVPRLVKRDVSIGGVELKEGELVTLILGASNTDGAEFAEAERVDFERARNRHVAFGAGPHRCLGSHLARMELQVALEEWHRRIPDYAVEPGETPRYSAGIREVQYLPLVWEAR